MSETEYERTYPRIKTFEHSNPSGRSTLETAYALMKEAEEQPVTEAGKFRAMDCHADLMDLRDASHQVREYQSGKGGWNDRISENQRRLHIA